MDRESALPHHPRYSDCVPVYCNDYVRRKGRIETLIIPEVLGDARERPQPLGGIL